VRLQNPLEIELYRHMRGARAHTHIHTQTHTQIHTHTHNIQRKLARQCTRIHVPRVRPQQNVKGSLQIPTSFPPVLV